MTIINSDKLYIYIRPDTYCDAKKNIICKNYRRLSETPWDQCEAIGLTQRLYLEVKLVNALCFLSRKKMNNVHEEVESFNQKDGEKF